MKGIFTLGLATVASAAHLRSSAQMDRVASHAGIAALAEKYDCVTGEGNLEDVLDEIAGKNVLSKAELEKSCAASFRKYNKELEAEQDAVEAIRVNARPNALAAELKKVADAKATYERLDSEHADTVENAEALSIRLQNEKDAHEVQYNGAKGEVAVYRAEVAQLVADRATAKGAYEAAMELARITLINGEKDESDIRDGKTTAANDAKVVDDNTCEVDYKARQDIAAKDLEIVDELISIEADLKSVSDRTVEASTDAATIKSTKAETAFLETKRVQVAAKAHANYNQMLATKNSEIAEFKAACATSLASYETAITRAKGVATTIRDETEGKHNAVYVTEFSAASIEYQTIEDRHTAAVGKATSDEASATQDAGEKQGDFDTKEGRYNTVKAVVTAERANALKKQTGDNAAIETARVAAEKDANDFFAKTMTESQDARTQEESACASAQSDRLAMIADDNAAIGEISKLVLKLGRCQGNTLEKTSFVEVATSKATVSKATMIESMSCGAVQARLSELRAASFLETASPISATTGNLQDFGNRVEQEKKLAKENREQCDLDAKTAFDNASTAADNLLATTVANAKSTAATETNTVNDTYATTTDRLDGKFAAAYDPYLTAKGLSEAANTLMATNKQTLATATATQALKVGAATTVRDNKIQVSTDKESKGVADDRAEADQIEGDAVAAHRVAVDAETAKCTAENAHLALEQQSLSKVVERLESLSKHHKGITGDDDSNMLQDIEEMKTAIQTEKDSSEADRTSCLSTSSTLRETTVSNANGKYDLELSILKGANTDSVAAAETEKTAQFDAHKDREETNNDNYATATTAYEKSITDKENAMADHVTALATQKQEMEQAHAFLIATKKTAPKQKQAEIDNKMDEARIKEEAASAAHCSLTNQMEENCESDRAILKDERETLVLTRTTIQKLVNVRDDKIGWDGDETTTTTQAPTWERL